MTPRTQDSPAVTLPADRSDCTAAGVVDFQELFEQAPCGYLMTLDDGTITGVNETFLHWTDHRRADLLGTRLQKMMPIGDQMLYSTHCSPQLVMSGAVAEILIEVIGKDGAGRAALLSASRTPPRDGAPAAVRVVIFSPHERRRYEQELVASLRRAEASEALRFSAEADLAHLALDDPLTGLPNRSGLTELLRIRLAQGGVTGSALAVLYLDLDHFKAVNDSRG